ncbi:hypothetical protein VTL71DRAFT_5125 [Oculimacula yallundae]|uniref:Aminoglycoside phosphotransferase domain-containing protein n=1 Tax=Oculimacula yallundae TaxID=86028 RepID=A0ABR4C0D8_9HELO
MADSSITGAESELEASCRKQTNPGMPAKPSTPTKRSSDSREDMERYPTQRDGSFYDSISNYSDDGQADDHTEDAESSITTLVPEVSSQRSVSPRTVLAATGSARPVQNPDDQDDIEDDDAEAAQLLAEKEQFETLRPQIHELCLHLGLGAPSKIEYIEGGSFNRIVGLTFPSSDNNECILRIPIYQFNDVHKEFEARELRNQVAIHLGLARHKSLPIPSVIAWDGTANNSLNLQYVLQNRLQGTTVDDVYYQLPVAEKLEIATAVAEMLLKIESVTFEKLGRLVGTEDVPITSDRTPASTTINAIQVTGYRDLPMQDGPVREKQAIIEFLTTLFEHRKQCNDYWTELGEMCDRLKEIALEMQNVGMFRVADNNSVLWHWDLSASNILIHKTSESSGKVSDGQSETLLESGHCNNVDEKTSGACHHPIELSFCGSGQQIANHTVNLSLEAQDGMERKSEVNVAIENQSGTTCHHKVQVTDGTPQPDDKQHEQQPHVDLSSSEKHSLLSCPIRNTSADKWIISGVLDWDDALAVPRVLSRIPPSWLWLNEDDRPPKRHAFLTYDSDNKPWRDLTREELLVKAHFDQVMDRADPTYLDDAYGRGVWLRALARFGVYPFEDSHELDRYEPFVEAWDAHYASFLRET